MHGAGAYNVGISFNTTQRNAQINKDIDELKRLTKGVKLPKTEGSRESNTQYAVINRGLPKEPASPPIQIPPRAKLRTVQNNPNSPVTQEMTERSNLGYGLEKKTTPPRLATPPPGINSNLSPSALQIPPETAPPVKMEVQQPKPPRDMVVENRRFEITMQLNLKIEAAPSNCKTIHEFIGVLKGYREALKVGEDVNLYIVNNKIEVQKAGYENKNKSAQLIPEDQLSSIYKEVMASPKKDARVAKPGSKANVQREELAVKDASKSGKTGEIRQPKPTEILHELDEILKELESDIPKTPSAAPSQPKTPPIPPQTPAPPKSSTGSTPPKPLGAKNPKPPAPNIDGSEGSVAAPKPASKPGFEKAKAMAVDQRRVVDQTFNEKQFNKIFETPEFKELKVDDQMIEHVEKLLTTPISLRGGQNPVHVALVQTMISTNDEDQKSFASMVGIMTSETLLYTYPKLNMSTQELLEGVLSCMKNEKLEPAQKNIILQFCADLLERNLCDNAFKANIDKDLLGNIIKQAQKNEVTNPAAMKLENNLNSMLTTLSEKKPQTAVPNSDQLKNQIDNLDSKRIKDVAKNMMLYVKNELNAADLGEFMQKEFSTEGTPHLLKCQSQMNDISNLIIKKISEKPKKFNLFYELAQQCKSNGDLLSFMSITAALRSTERSMRKLNMSNNELKILETANQIQQSKEMSDEDLDKITMNHDEEVVNKYQLSPTEVTRLNDAEKLMRKAKVSSKIRAKLDTLATESDLRGGKVIRTLLEQYKTNTASYTYPLNLLGPYLAKVYDQGSKLTTKLAVKSNADWPDISRINILKLLIEQSITCYR